MVRFAFLALIASALVGSAFALALDIPDSTVHTSASWSYLVCDAKPSIVKVQDILVLPDPPVPGENLTVTVLATVEEEIEEGAYADVVVKLGAIKLLQKQFDLCEEARKNNATIQCPVQPGEYEVTHTVMLPKEVPRAKFLVQVRGFTVDDEDLLCVDLRVDFMKKPWGLFGL